MEIKNRSQRVLLCAAALLAPLALHAQSVTISPGWTPIGVNDTLQYSATVTGLTNTAVTWYVGSVKGGNSTLGTITTGGLYKAPATIPTASITVTVKCSDNKTTNTVYVALEPPGPPITAISPNPILVGNSKITVTGTGFKSGAIVRIPGANLSTTFVNSTTLTASLYQGTAGTIAFQVENPSTLWGSAFNATFVKSGPPPAQTISPASATVKLGATQQFTSAGATSWSASAGTVSTSGLYAAPTVMPSTSAVTVTATGPGGSASAAVTLQVQNPQAISPTSVSLNLGGTQQFTSAGATSWAATYGSVTGAGFYTAPAALPSSGTDTVTATGPNGNAAATVTLIPPTPTITGVGSGGQLPLGTFSTTITGSGFSAASVAKLNGTALGTTLSGGALTVTGFASASGAGSMVVSNGASNSAPFPVYVGVPNAVVTAAAARRFLEQAAFGPTPTDASNVQTLGFQGWLNQQYNAAPVSNYNVDAAVSQGGMSAHMLTNAVTNPDQLRQRVGFVLGQIFVTSINKLIWNDTMVPYQNMLLNDAFTNYRQIMGDVTLSPAMGQYLDMANNAMANPTTGSVANENYARELMQLFTIGTQMLNQDGSLQLNGGLPVPTYSQFTITEFARVYTGWTYAPAAGQPVQWNSYISSNGPMVPYAPEHDPGSKQLLSGYVSPAGATAQQDLNNALDNVFNHPNMGPFVGKLLIQFLVKSNPSPQYISRVAAAFNNNGQGVRGDMKSILSAILLDAEARGNDNGGSDQVGDGHLQEPALYIAGMVRAFGGQMTDQNYFTWDLTNLSQDIFNSPSVFNYYSPSYAVPGTSLLGGEFEINTPNNAIWRANMARGLFSQWSNPVQNYGPGTTVDLTPFVSLAATPATLVSALDLTLTHGTMPAGMKSTILSAVTSDPGGALQKVEDAVYLILTSGYYNVWH